MKPTHHFSDLLALMARLRTDCPWDAKQTNDSLIPYAIEEAYELAEAVAMGDVVAVKSELGDVLLQVVFHAHLYDEQGAFDIHEVIYTLQEKLIRRHPHVFDQENLKTDEDVKRRWDEIKVLENQHKPPRPWLAKKSGTALMQAQEIQKQTAKVGFDWGNLQGVVDKLHEELGELQAVLPSGDFNYKTDQLSDEQKHAISDELGDCLFVLMNLARHLGIDGETSALGAVNKFRRRFALVEDELAKQGKTPKTATLDEMDTLWHYAKVQERR